MHNKMASKQAVASTVTCVLVMGMVHGATISARFGDFESLESTLHKPEVVQLLRRDRRDVELDARVNVAKDGGIQQQYSSGSRRAAGFTSGGRTGRGPALRLGASANAEASLDLGRNRVSGGGGLGGEINLTGASSESDSQTGSQGYGSDIARRFGFGSRRNGEDSVFGQSGSEGSIFNFGRNRSPSPIAADGLTRSSGTGSFWGLGSRGNPQNDRGNSIFNYGSRRQLPAGTVAGLDLGTGDSSLIETGGSEGGSFLNDGPNISGTSDSRLGSRLGLGSGGNGQSGIEGGSSSPSLNIAPGRNPSVGQISSSTLGSGNAQSDSSRGGSFFNRGSRASAGGSPASSSGFRSGFNVGSGDNIRQEGGNGKPSETSFLNSRSDANSNNNQTSGFVPRPGLGSRLNDQNGFGSRNPSAIPNLGFNRASTDTFSGNSGFGSASGLGGERDSSGRDSFSMNRGSERRPGSSSTTDEVSANGPGAPLGLGGSGTFLGGVPGQVSGSHSDSGNSPSARVSGSTGASGSGFFGRSGRRPTSFFGGLFEQNPRRGNTGSGNIIQNESRSTGASGTTGGSATIGGSGTTSGSGTTGFFSGLQRFGAPENRGGNVRGSGGASGQGSGSGGLGFQRGDPRVSGGLNADLGHGVARRVAAGAQSFAGSLAEAAGNVAKGGIHAAVSGVHGATGLAHGALDLGTGVAEAAVAGARGIGTQDVTRLHQARDAVRSAVDTASNLAEAGLNVRNGIRDRVLDGIAGVTHTASALGSAGLGVANTVADRAGGILYGLVDGAVDTARARRDLNSTVRTA